MDYSEDEFLITNVGERLRDLRTKRKKSMRTIARESGLSTNALSMIERGRTSPSVNTLHKLAVALEIPITAFFRPDATKQEIVFSKAGDRRNINFPRGKWEGLGGDNFSGSVEPLMLTIEKDAQSGPFGMRHSGYEFVYCLDGQIDYEVENENYSLLPGDCLIFSAQLQHRWQNSSDSITKVIILLTAFDQGERPSEYHFSSVRKSD